MQVQPHQDAEQRIQREAWQLTPPLALHAYTDLYGNTCQRMLIPPGSQILSYDATIEVSGLADEVAPDAVQLPVEALPDEVLHYTLPSRFCLSDVLRFQYGTSNSLTTAADVCAAGVGVCRDLAHLAVTFCRALNIPARYVFGYLPDIGVPPPDAPMDFCAWMEVYLSERWWTFDPRNNEPRIGRVLIGRGRDALDVAMVTTYGSPRLAQMTVWAEEALPAPHGATEASDPQASSLRGDRQQA
jgi:transglutaminase-like putative cysteine protease